VAFFDCFNWLVYDIWMSITERRGMSFIIDFIDWISDDLLSFERSEEGDGMIDSYNENITYVDDSLPYPSMFHFLLLVVVVGICLVYQYELFKLL